MSFFKKSNQISHTISYQDNLQKLKNLGPYCLLSWLMIIISIFASKMGVFANNTQFYIALDLLIAVTVLFLGIKKSCTTSQYAIIIFGVSLSLLFQHSLLSDFVVGQDIQSELLYAINLMNNGFWDISVNSQINSSAGSLLLGSLFSILFKINLQWIFKILFPFIFAFVPVFLFQIFRDIFKEKIAFISVIFFISFFTFYDLMISLPRQMLAEFFLCLILLLMIGNINIIWREYFLFYCIHQWWSYLIMSWHFMFSIVFFILFLFLNMLPIFNNYWKTNLLGNKYFSNAKLFLSLKTW